MSSLDVNECLRVPSECSEDEYCVNTYGSYSCRKCHESCKSCNSSSNLECTECKNGYRRNEETNACDDINECEEQKSICGKYECVNKAGSYDCTGK